MRSTAKAFVVALALASGVSFVGMKLQAAAPAQAGLVATEVPPALPAQGVDINHQIVLEPTNAVPTVSQSKAIALARKLVNARPFPASALLSRLTVPSTIPPAGTHIPFRTIRHRLAWIVTFTSPAPVNVAQGGVFPASVGKAKVLWATHYSIAIDARTGQFLVGFFTK